MVIPQTFKSSIKNTFYDKTLSIYEVQDTVDDEGWAAYAGTTVVTGTFKGNINFSKLDSVREDYGIETEIDATITTDQNIALDQIIGYLGTQYKVIRSIAFDSHYLLIVEKWLSKSSTLISS